MTRLFSPDFQPRNANGVRFYKKNTFICIGRGSLDAMMFANVYSHMTCKVRDLQKLLRYIRGED